MATVIEQTEDQERTLAVTETSEDAMRIIAALRYHRNGGGQSGETDAPNIDTDWEVR